MDINIMISSIFLITYYGLYASKKRENSWKGLETPGRQVVIHLKQILLHIINMVSGKSIHWVMFSFIKLYKIKVKVYNLNP